MPAVTIPGHCQAQVATQENRQALLIANSIVRVFPAVFAAQLLIAA